MISNSNYTPPGIVSFFGSAILIAAMAGWFLSLIEFSIAHSLLSNTEWSGTDARFAETCPASSDFVFQFPMQH